MENMLVRFKSLLFATLFFPLLAQSQPPQLIYNAILSGEEVVPAVVTNGKGLLTLVFSPDRSKVTISGMLVNLDGQVTSALLRSGKKGETNGTILLDLLPMITGRLMSGEMSAPPGLLPNLVADHVYIDIRTNTHLSGEVRGQVTGETDLDFRCVMTGAEALPSSGSTAMAFGGIHFPTGSDEIVYAFLVRGLSGPATGASIYEGAPGANGVWVADMPTLFTNTIQGVIEIKNLGDNFIQKCIEGRYYAVIKTASYPDGEVRGQFTFLGHLCAFAPINGVQPVPPPSATTGFGFSHTTPTPMLDSLRTVVMLDGITPVTAMIQVATPGANGPVLYDLEKMPMPGVYAKTYPVTATQLTDFIEGRLYVNFGTDAFPNGEIRGQLKNTLRKGYAFDLCGSQMVPPNTSTALGIAMASIDQNDCYINYQIIVDGLNGTPTEAHLRQGLPGQNGPSLYPMATTDPIIPGLHAVMASQAVLIEEGNTYMVIHTPAFPDGEIRGQIRRGLTCPLLSDVHSPEEISDVSVWPVPLEETMYVALNSDFDGEAQLILRDIVGKTVLKQPLHITTGEQQFQLSTGYLPKGAYILTIRSSGQIQRERLLRVVIKGS